MGLFKQLCSLGKAPCPEINITAADTKNAYSWEKPCLAIARILDINIGKVLEITLYKKDKSFAARTWLYDGGTKWLGEIAGKDTKSESMLHNLLNCNVVDYYAYPVFDKAGTEAVQSFFQSKSENVYDVISTFQNDVRANKVRERRDKIRRSIADEMLEIKEPPADFKSWIKKTVFADHKYIFYDYKKTTKKITGYCTACEHEVEIIGQKSNQPGVCPRCHKPITFKSRGKAGGIIAETDYVYYFQPTQKGYCIREFGVHQETRSTGSINILMSERGRQFERYDKGYAPSFSWDNFMNTGGWDWCRGGYYASSTNLIYPNNISKIAAKAGAKYTPVKEIVKLGKLPAGNLFNYVRDNSPVEFLSKLKLYKLCRNIICSHYDRDFEEILNLKGAKMSEVLIGIDKFDIPVLQKLDVSYTELSIYQKLKACGYKDAAEQVILFERENHINCSNLLSYGKNYGPAWRPLKTIKYIEAQFELLKDVRLEKSRWNGEDKKYASYSEIAQEYHDYLENAKLLAYDLSDDFIFYPKNLMERHDETSVIVAAIEKGKAAYPGVALMEQELNESYYFEKSGLLIRAPHDSMEIVSEGQKLHHCVARYAKSMAKGETIILFIRKISKPDKPFYTLELKDGKVTQCYGKGDCVRTKEVSKFVEDWVKAKVEVRQAVA